MGTAHGFYEGKPEIHFDRLCELAAAAVREVVNRWIRACRADGKA